MPRPPASRLVFPAAPAASPSGGVGLWLRAIGCIAGLALLAACGSHGPRTSARSQAARYAAMARGDYTPPGPPEDPWGPYIHEARRFDVPGTSIRAVMHVESGGNQYHERPAHYLPGAGAMGLMQVMPETYDELRARYDLAPTRTIRATISWPVTAYLREMYDIYGAPGFLAAYNAGPRRLDDYLADHRPLPEETRRYVAMIGPAIVGSYPRRVSPAASLCNEPLPIDIPPGLRYAHGRYAPVQIASRSMPVPPPVPYQPAVRLAEAVPPPRVVAPARTRWPI